MERPPPPLHPPAPPFPPPPRARYAPRYTARPAAHASPSPPPAAVPPPLLQVADRPAPPGDSLLAPAQAQAAGGELGLKQHEAERSAVPERYFDKLKETRARSKSSAPIPYRSPPTPQWLHTSESTGPSFPLLPSLTPETASSITNLSLDEMMRNIDPQIVLEDYPQETVWRDRLKQAESWARRGKPKRLPFEMQDELWYPGLDDQPSRESALDADAPRPPGNASGAMPRTKPLLPISSYADAGPAPKGAMLFRERLQGVRDRVDKEKGMAGRELLPVEEPSSEYDLEKKGLRQQSLKRTRKMRVQDIKKIVHSSWKHELDHMYKSRRGGGSEPWFYLDWDTELNQWVVRQG